MFFKNLVIIVIVIFIITIVVVAFVVVANACLPIENINKCL